MATWKFDWERLGRGTPPPPTFVDIAPDPWSTLADRLAEAAFDIARPRLISRDVNVTVDLDAESYATGAVTVTAGWHTAGTGLVVRVPDDEPEPEPEPEPTQLPIPCSGDRYLSRDTWS